MNPAGRERPLTLRFDAPAQSFLEALPLGNGRIGAMVFGGVEKEHLVLNEISLWSGSPDKNDRGDAHRALPEIRRLLFAGKNDEAERLVNQNFTCAGRGSGHGRGANVPYGSYQVLGELTLEFAGESAPEYRRELDLEIAIARIASGSALRECFASGADDVLVYRAAASPWTFPGQRAGSSAPGSGPTEPRKFFCATQSRSK